MQKISSKLIQLRSVRIVIRIDKIYKNIFEVFLFFLFYN